MSGVTLQIYVDSWINLVRLIQPVPQYYAKPATMNVK